MIPQRLQPSITEELKIAENVSSKFHRMGIRKGAGNEIEIMMETSKLSPELFHQSFLKR
jgi:hypothetical protein